MELVEFPTPLPVADSYKLTNRETLTLFYHGAGGVSNSFTGGR
jgi:hypothetical protein